MRNKRVGYCFQSQSVRTFSLTSSKFLNTLGKYPNFPHFSYSDSSSHNPRLTPDSKVTSHALVYTLCVQGTWDKKKNFIATFPFSFSLDSDDLGLETRKGGESIDRQIPFLYLIGAIVILLIFKCDWSQCQGMRPTSKANISEAQEHSPWRRA